MHDLFGGDFSHQRAEDKTPSPEAVDDVKIFYAGDGGIFGLQTFGCTSQLSFGRLVIGHGADEGKMVVHRGAMPRKDPHDLLIL